MSLISFWIPISILLGALIISFVVNKKSRNVAVIPPPPIPVCVTCGSNAPSQRMSTRRGQPSNQCDECFGKVTDNLFGKAKRRECVICLEKRITTWTSCCGQPLHKKCAARVTTNDCPYCREANYQLVSRPLWADRAFEVENESQ